MTDYIPMTQTGYNKIKAEVDRLENEEMPKIADKIATARAEGDLRENAEYHGARETQGMMQAKIHLLRDKLSRASIVDISKLAKDEVVFGCTVTVKDLDFDDEEVFTLVGAGEEDYDKGRILVTSPIGQGLLGKKIGQIAEIAAPKGTIKFEVVSIRWEEQLAAGEEVNNSKESRMSTTPYQQPATMPKQFDPPPQKSTGRTCLIGCLVILLVMVLLCGCGGIWAYFYLGGIVVGGIRNGIQQGINESGMAEEDKREVMAQVDRVNDAYQAGEINTQDLMRVSQELLQSPVMASFMVYAIEEKYLKPSGLTEEEKASARLVLQRVMRGIVEKKINPDSLDLAPVMEGGGNQKKLKDKVTDEELREVLKKLKARADEEMIPDEPYEVRIGEEMKEAVDKALKPGPTVD